MILCECLNQLNCIRNPPHFSQTSKKIDRKRCLDAFLLKELNNLQEELIFRVFGPPTWKVESNVLIDPNPALLILVD